MTRDDMSALHEEARRRKPPSVVPAGAYTWASSPDEETAQAPEWLVRMMRGKR